MTANTSTHRDSKNPVPIPVDDAVESLNNYRRRQVVLLIDAADEMPTAGELAEEIAAMENDCLKEQLTAQQRKRVYISLIQAHLPTLDRAGVIHYYEPTKAVAATAATEPLADFIRELNAMCHP